MNMKEIIKQAEDKIDIITATSIEVMELIAKAAWNEAIEAAANELRMNTTGDWVNPLLEQIRRLKK